MVRYLHDETIKGMSEHKQQWQLMQNIKLPSHLQPADGRSPVPWYVRTIWEEYTGWFKGEQTSELYATPAKAIWPELVAMAGGTDSILQAAQQQLDKGDAEKALHFVEMAIETEPQNKAVRKLEVAVLSQLIEANAGKHYDELGWLETAIQSAQQVIDS